jgi:hypothetical protein
MKNTIQALSLALALASPFAMTLDAMAQEQITRPAVVQQVAQRDNELNTFFSSGYDYWDAAVLSEFWGMSMIESKAYIGRKLAWGGQSKALLQQHMLDARMKALGRVDELKLFFDAGFGYDDAAKLAEFWGDSSPWETKLRVERNLIMGDYEVVTNALRMAKKS